MIVRQNEYADIRGISPPAISQKINLGMPVRYDRKVHTDVCMDWEIKHAKNLLVKRKNDSLAQYYDMQRKKIEFQIRRQSGQYCEKSEIHETITDRLYRLRLVLTNSLPRYLETVDVESRHEFLHLMVDFIERELLSTIREVESWNNSESASIPVSGL